MSIPCGVVEFLSQVVQDGNIVVCRDIGAAYISHHRKGGAFGRIGNGYITALDVFTVHLVEDICVTAEATKMQRSIFPHDNVALIGGDTLHGTCTGIGPSRTVGHVEIQ